MLLSLVSMLYIHAMRVEVRPLSYVPSTQITLLDVVETKGLSKQQKQRLKSIELANELSPNSYRTFNKDFLIELLRKSKKLKNAKIQIPEKAYVANTSNIWTKKNIEASLREKLTEKCVTCEIEINIVQFNKIHDVIGWNFDLSKDLRNQRVYVPVTAETLSGTSIQPRSTQIVADIYYRKVVPVLSKNVDRGSQIAKDDLVMKKILLPSHGRFYTDLDDVVGMKTKRVLKQGQLLLFSDIEKTLDVKRGEQVRLLFKNNNIEISISAIAKENGSIGEMIKIAIPESKKEMQAKVISASEVEVQ